jgi:hypothetical protein
MRAGSRHHLPRLAELLAAAQAFAQRIGAGRRRRRSGGRRLGFHRHLDRRHRDGDTDEDDGADARQVLLSMDPLSCR